MPWQWISRFFNQDSSKSPIYNKDAIANSSKSEESADNKDLGKGSDEQDLIQSTSKDLELAFFCWLLNCTKHDLQYNPNQVSEKEQEFLKILDQADLNLDQLPRRPTSFPLLIKLLNDESASTGEISKTLLSDPALATQTLKTANSPFFRVSNETIDSVEQAVFILGIEGIRNIISATVMMPMMKGKNSREGEFSNKVWEWGLLSGTASDQYSQLQGQETGALYILGLLPALTYLLIYRSLLSYQHTHTSLGNIDASLIKSIIQKRSWKMCHDICQQWGLPPASNKYLLDAERPSPTNSYSPLRDGIFMGTYKVLESMSNSPINDLHAFSLTSASKTVDKKVAKCLDDKIKAKSI